MADADNALAPLKQTSVRLFEFVLRQWHRVLALLFPPACLACGQSHTLLCGPCQDLFLRHKVRPQFITPQSRAASPDIDSLWAAASYQGLVRNVIRAYKYHRQGPTLNGPLGMAIIIAWQHATKPAQIAKSVQTAHTHNKTRVIIVPAPISLKKFRQRGYNQALLLTRALSQHTQIPVFDILLRNRDTAPQHTLSKQERVTNMQNAITIKPGAKVTNCTVFVVDDIVTTGATLDACAKALRNAGAKQVHGLVAAFRK